MLRDLLTSPWLPGVAVGIALLAAIYALMEARDLLAERDEHESDAKYWLDYVCWLEGRTAHPVSPKFTPETAKQFIHHLKYGFPDERPDVVGTPSRPIPTLRGDDTARWAQLSEFVGPRTVEGE